jgi:hypothetical protein
MIAPPPRRLSSEIYWLALRDRWPFFLFGGIFTLFPILMLLPLPFFALLIPAEPDQKKIMTQGQETTAVVTRVETNNSMEINGTNPRKVYFHYNINGIEKHGEMDTMSVDEVSSWQPGRQISIKYFGDEATIPELQPVDFPFWLFGAIFIAFSLVFSTIGLIPLGYGLYAAWKKIRVLRCGHVQRVCLLSISERGAAFGPLLSLLGINRFEASYSSVDVQGAPIIGRATTADLLFVKQYQTGSEIEILSLAGHEVDSLVLDAVTAARLNVA